MSEEQKCWAHKFLEIIDGVLIWKRRLPCLNNSYITDNLFNSKYAGAEAGGKAGFITILGTTYGTDTILEAMQDGYSD